MERLPIENDKTTTESSNFKSTVLADGVVLITYVSMRIDPKGKTQFLRSLIWRKNTIGWQMEFHQGTVKI